jgi:hypothetical protein
VTDNSGRLVPDLDKIEFEILEDQKPRAVDLFQSEALPITVVVMLDTSGSMTLSVDEVKLGAEQFLIRLLPLDKGMVGAFNDKIQFTGPFTADRDDLVSSLKDLDFGYPTRLYDAIDASMNELQNIDGRRVVIVFTDGEDTASKLSEGTVVDRARREGVMIYGIGLESEYFNGQQKARSGVEEARGGHRRRLLRVEAHRRSQHDLHACGPGAPQPVRARLLPGGARWQDTQGRGTGEASGNDRPDAQDVRRCRATDLDDPLASRDEHELDEHQCDDRRDEQNADDGVGGAGEIPVEAPDHNVLPPLTHT